jgi:hypothetical protein
MACSVSLAATLHDGSSYLDNFASAQTRFYRIVEDRRVDWQFLRYTRHSGTVDP